MRIKTILVALAAAAGFATGAAQAQNLIVNGDFELLSNGAQQFDQFTQVTGWTSSGYNFVFAPSTADTSGTFGQYGGLTLWGPNNGSNNGLSNSTTGGNFVAADGAYLVAPIQQTVSGLTAGKQYTLSFDWAGAQQHGYDGVNTEQWIVSLGNQTQSTSTYVNSSHGFSGWMHETMTFTAANSTEVLSFLAHGTPNGVPPFSLLDGVSMIAAVPEPGTWEMMIGGLGLLGFMLNRRRNKGAAK